MEGGTCCWRKLILPIAVHLGMESCESPLIHVHMPISDIILQVLFRQRHCCSIISVASLSCIKGTTMQHTLWLPVSSGMFPEPYEQGCVVDLSGPHSVQGYIVDLSMRLGSSQSGVL